MRPGSALRVGVTIEMLYVVVMIVLDIIVVMTTRSVMDINLGLGLPCGTGSRNCCIRFCHLPCARFIFPSQSVDGEIFALPFEVIFPRVALPA